MRETDYTTIRTCLKCQKEFNSASPGNRICPTCNRINEKAPPIAAKTTLEPDSKPGSSRVKRGRELGNI